tara:strand:- start:51 stop:221 length:171 start_codon:yes stop_codon:yes gene_type:complete
MSTNVLSDLCQLAHQSPIAGYRKAVLMRDQAILNNRLGDARRCDEIADLAMELYNK